MPGDRRVPAGECPECGPVAGDAVDLDFPNEPTCACGAELERAGYVDAEVAP